MWLGLLMALAGVLLLVCRRQWWRFLGEIRSGETVLPEPYEEGRLMYLFSTIACPIILILGGILFAVTS